MTTGITATDHIITPAPPPLARGDGPTRPPAAGTHLRRLRWAVRAALTVGVAASVAANILHADPHLISQMIAAWPPLALLLTVELISRVPTHRRALAAIRLAATAGIAGIAAWVSYWHMAGVAARYGETEAAASYLLPLSVDGLVIVASVSLVEITGRLHSADATPAAALPPMTTGPTPAAPTPPPSAEVTDLRSAAAVASRPASRSRRRPPAASTTATPVAAPRRPANEGARRELDRSSVESAAAASDPTGALPAHHADATTTGSRRRGHRAPPAAHGQPPDAARPDDRDEAPVPPQTPAAVAFWYQRDPGMHPAEIAEKIGRSERTVRRYWPPVPRQAANGQRPTRT